MYSKYTSILVCGIVLTPFKLLLFLHSGRCKTFVIILPFTKSKKLLSSRRFFVYSNAILQYSNATLQYSNALLLTLGPATDTRGHNSVSKSITRLQYNNNNEKVT